MIINGQDREFRLTVGAIIELSALCPDDDISKIDTLLLGDNVRMFKNIPKVAVILNKWSAPVVNGDQQPITEKDCLSLGVDEFTELSQAVLKGFGDGKKTTVETEPVKKKDVNKATL